MTALRVVVVDDHPTFRSGLRAVFTAAQDIDVVAEAASGEQAVAAVAEHRPDVVLMDLAMPGMGGLEAIRQVTAAGSTRVLVLTMSDAESSAFAALRAGAHGYLLKDAGPEEILDALRAVRRGDAVIGHRMAARVLTYFTSARAAAARPFPGLSEREREVLDLLADGRDNATIAAFLFLSPKTVRNHVSSVLGKLQAANRAEAGARARDAGLGTRTS